MDNYNNLQIREIFHIEFLRAFAKKFKPSFYALKGGVNMRLYFKSMRYSEDMDLDINTVDVGTLKESVMRILNSANFSNNLKTFGINEVRPPDISKAKQTNTTQRFKIHLINTKNEDLFTKIEFSRRDAHGSPVTEAVSASILYQYKTLPLIVSHYDAPSVYIQKIGALAGRSVVQARDVFDLFILSSQHQPDENALNSVNDDIIKTASDNALSIGFNQFRDTVLSYLENEDKNVYDSPEVWDEIKLKVNTFICRKIQH